MIEGALRTFGPKFAQNVLEHIDYMVEDEPFVIENLMKAQKKAQIDVFKFDLVRSFFLYKDCGALRKKDIAEITEAIKKLDERKTRSILAARYKTFKRKMIAQATGNQIGAEYVATQIEQQLNDFCKQISLFEDFK